MVDRNPDPLLLDNQLCFPLYAASRLITRLYHPLLEKLDITYPQYLILLVLWEEEGQTIHSIGKKLLLETNTLTPLLKRMESKGIIKRTRSQEDERKVVISLTSAGRKKREEAACIPIELMKSISETYPVENMVSLREEVRRFLSALEGSET